MIFADDLYTSAVNENFHHLPSPESLKRKFLVKVCIVSDFFPTSCADCLRADNFVEVNLQIVLSSIGLIATLAKKRQSFVFMRSPPIIVSYIITHSTNSVWPGTSLFIFYVFTTSDVDRI